MNRLMGAAHEQKLHLRLIGGLAIKVHSPSASHRALQRSYPDIDLVVPKRDKRKLDTFFDEMGYIPEKNFTCSTVTAARFFTILKPGGASTFLSAISRCVTNCPCATASMLIR